MRAKINLAVGIVKHEPGWEILLNQIGVQWRVISSYDEELSVQYGAIILNTICTREQKKALELFLSSGGAILSIHGSADQLLALPTYNLAFASLAPLTSDFAKTSGILDIYSTGKAFDYNSVVSKHHCSRGIIINIPFAMNFLMTWKKRGRKNFYFGKERLPNEIVSKIAKAQLRTLVSSALEYLYHERGLPFIHKWYFPEDHPTVFTFRIDSDKATQEEAESVFQLSNKYKIPTTWFLDVKSHEKWLPYFSTFTEQEIALHCYDHKTFNTVEQNFNNFAKAQRLLQLHAIGAAGASAPRGNWNESISISFEKLNLLYSSEFSFDYDNFPSFPWLGSSFSSVIQLPVHPVCSGTMRRAGYSARDQSEYFLELIDKNTKLREPICLYHHPTHHYNEVFESVFSAIREKNIPTLSYSGYASWWKKRLNCTGEFIFDTETQAIVPNTNSAESGIYWRVSVEPNKEAILKITNSISLNTMDFSQYTSGTAVPSDIMRARKFDPRHILINVLEYYYRLKE